MSRSRTAACPRRGVAVVAAGSALAVVVALGGASPAAALPPTPQGVSDLRVGVLALADAFAAVGRTPELATPLPLTDTAPADVLELDRVVGQELVTALQEGDVAAALGQIPGITDVEQGDGTISFGYSRTVPAAPVRLAVDDGTLRLGTRQAVGTLAVTLATPDAGARFELAVDPDQQDPLLRFALTSQPELELSMDLDVPSIPGSVLAGAAAREGFTALDVDAGRYRLHREAAITMRDPDGRSWLTLEDLRYSTLPDLFRIERDADAELLDVSLGLAVPGGVDVRGGADAARRGTLSLGSADVPDGGVWPTSTDAARDYGQALQALTGLTQVDGVAALGRWTGLSLALQDVADVPFPQLGGSTTDLFAPGSSLVDLLTTGAAAQVRCGAAPATPPVGHARPGDMVYCDAVLPEGLEDPTGVTWTVHGDNGTLGVVPASGTLAAPPTAVVPVAGSDGEPDVSVSFTSQGRRWTARTLPTTVQDVAARIRALGSGSSASPVVDVAAERLEVPVAIRGGGTADLPVGNPGALGALVGLTGLESSSGATASVRGTGGEYRLGFGIPTGAVTEGQERPTLVVPPADGVALRLAGVSATKPDGLTGLPARIGFLAVKADVTDLALGVAGDGPAVALTVPAGGVRPLTDLVDDEGAVRPTAAVATSRVTGSVAITATETPLPGSARPPYATGGSSASSGSTAVSWGASGTPTVSFGAGYETLRVFDPVPAAFLRGTARVTEGGGDGADTATIALDGGLAEVRDALSLDAGTDTVEVARRLLGPGIGCQNITLAAGGPSGALLSCEGLTPNGSAAVADGDGVELVVLGDPFAVRDGVLEGLGGALVELDRLDDDHLADGPEADQYTSALPLVDLVPAQLAAERADLGTLLGDIDAAAIEDEEGVGANAYPGVSSAQELVGAVPGLLDGASVGLSVAGGSVGTRLTASSATSPSAPLRLFDDDRGQVVSSRRIAVPTTSSTVLGAAVDAATAASSVTDATGTVSTATVDLDGGALAGALRIGVGEGTVASGGSSAGLEVSVATTREGGVLRTRRSSPRGASAATATLVLEGAPVAGAAAARSQDEADAAPDEADPVTEPDAPEPGAAEPEASEPGAAEPEASEPGVAEPEASEPGVAEPGATDSEPETQEAEPETELETELEPGASLAQAAPQAVADEPDVIVFSASADSSSGGAGAPPEDPVAMKVKFLAEGLDGLAFAVGQGLDGAAVRNTGGGPPVSMPLVGTDLEAGADVTQELTTLTSALRTELAKLGDELTAQQLGARVQQAVTDAVASRPDLSLDGTPRATVLCGADPCAGSATAFDWDDVTVAFSIDAAQKQGEAPFEIGLAGLNVRSDKPVTTTTSWSLPVELALVRGVGPVVRVGTTGLDLEVAAHLPDGGCEGVEGRCLPAIMGYLPARLTPHAGDESAAASGTVAVTPVAAGQLDLFDVYDGKLRATPSFVPGGTETGLHLDYLTTASGSGSFDLKGDLEVPWTPAGFGDVTYGDVQWNLGQVIATLTTPFAVADPYLAPVRQVVNVMRTPMPVVSDLAELAGQEPITLLSILQNLAGKKARLELPVRIIDFVTFASDLASAVAKIGAEKDGTWVSLKSVGDLGALLTVEPGEVEAWSSCRETTKTVTPAPAPGGTGTTTGTVPATERVTTTVAPCDPPEDEQGAADQTTKQKRRGDRGSLKNSVTEVDKSVNVSVPGFSLPFLEDPDQLVDVLTGEGEASYFRLDFGSLTATIAYTRSFGPIMAGPVPIKPFIGGSISVSGRLAMGFDSYPQTLAVQRLGNPGAVDELNATYTDVEDVIAEGFYVDDLDAEGVDVPEVQLVATLEGGAGVSIGIVSAGLKGGVTLTLDLDLNDPNRDGKIRPVEIRSSFAGNAKCIFDVSADLEAFIAVYVEIDLFLTTMSWAFDIVRLGPYELFRHSCPTLVPVLVAFDQGANRLALTSGVNAGLRKNGIGGDASEAYEVRQFDTGGGASSGGATTYEVTAFDRVQRVKVEKSGGGYAVTTWPSGVTLSTGSGTTVTTSAATPPTFLADGAGADDRLQFLPGEVFDDAGELVTSAFSADVRATGGSGKDVISTGSGADVVDGGSGVDAIESGPGADVVDGGGDDDVINGDAGSDDLRGGSGADRVQGGPGADRADGGEGDDSLTGGPGLDVRAVLLSTREQGLSVARRQAEDGFDSGDVLVGGPGTDSVDGGDGSDVVVGGTAPTLLGGTLGGLLQPVTRTVNVLVEGENDGVPQETAIDVTTVTVPGPAALDGLCVSGDAASATGEVDYVSGGAEPDVLVGGDGDDALDGGEGSDELCGRAGDDVLTGDSGQTGRDDETEADVMRGGHGDDRMAGGDGPDTLFGDDVALLRGGDRVLDGSLGGSAGGAGADHLDGGKGADVMSGGRGPDLLLGGAGGDRVFGEGLGLAQDGGDAPGLDERLVDCAPTTRVVRGGVDVNGDLASGAFATQLGAASDDGRLTGLEVLGGRVRAVDGTWLTGLLGEVVLIDGWIDLDRDGRTDAADTGVVDLASMGAPRGGNVDGDCVIAGDGDDLTEGGAGSDHLSLGDGVDLGRGGDGNDLLLGDAGTDVLLGQAHHDVLVAGDGDDQLVGGDGDDRLRGNEGDDALVGGSESGGARDGEDLLLGGRGYDALVGENATVVMAGVATGTATTTADLRAALPPTARADAGSGLRFAGAVAPCGGTPQAWVTVLPGADQARAGTASPGESVPAWDELYGGFDCDLVLGSVGDDVVRGGQDDDLVEGGAGDDLVKGDAGDDVAVGGTSTDSTKASRYDEDRAPGGAPDGDDTVVGDGGPDGEVGDDLLAGDDAVSVPGPDGWSLALHGLGSLVAPASRTTGADLLLGTRLAGDYARGDADEESEADADELHGQGGADTLRGQGGDDRAEGGPGTDALDGGDGSDLLLGGTETTRVEGSAVPGTTDVLRPDAGDTIDGGAGADLVLGDDGHAARVDAQPPSAWTVRLSGIQVEDAFGADTVAGGDGEDLLLGQAGADTLAAGTGDDRVEGGPSGDLMTGGSGVDLLLGGSEPDRFGAAADTAYPDGVDTIDGGTDPDLLLGDNAHVERGSGHPQGWAVQLQRGGVEATYGDDVLDGGDGAAPAPGLDDVVLGQGGDDGITGGTGDDHLVGNEGADTIGGGAGDDDVVGGSTATDGRPLGGRLGGSVTDLDVSASGTPDGGDRLDGDDGDDVVLGDNGRITRGAAPRTGLPLVRDTAMADVAPGASSGADRITGDGGRDVLVGQLGGPGGASGDDLDGGEEQDVLLGDLGVVTPVPASTLGAPTTLRSTAGNLSEDVLTGGTWVGVVGADSRLVASGGADRLLGGVGDDSLRGGPGADLANGQAGDDTVLGGDGGDALWGGLDHDRIFGGRGDDNIDVKKLPGNAWPSTWSVIAGGEDDDNRIDTTNGADLAYGGWGADVLQADQGGAGRQPGSDQLIDWVGDHNLFRVCAGAYGQGRVIRSGSPAVVDVLEGLVRAAGGLDADTSGTGAWTDLGLVSTKDNKSNSAPYPGKPGNFTCEAG